LRSAYERRNDRVIYVEAGDEKSVLICFEEACGTAALALS
jgi:hypothetical protein